MSFEQVFAAATSPNATKEDFFALAELYENSPAPIKNLEKALEYYTKASDLGHGTATRYAGYLCRSLAASGNNDYAKMSVDFYTKAASGMTDARAMAVLGYFYEKGLTTTGADVNKGGSSPAAAASAAGLALAPDAKKAVEWYKAAIKTGADDGTAAVNLALMYEKGIVSGATSASSVPLEDKVAAFELFKSVADSPTCRNAAALINTGLYYEKGEKEGVVPKDMATALNKYYLRAAKLGDSTAMAIVGCCYETGQGCDIDYDTAADFYVRGAMAGNNHAREGLRRLRDAGKI